MAISRLGRQDSRGSTPTRATAVARYLIDPIRRTVVVRFGRKLTVDDIAHYTMLLRSDPCFDPTLSEIVDLRETEELNLQSDDFFTLADKIDPFSPAAKRAFVVRTSVQKHAARMHKILRTQRNIEIFASLDEAERWINEKS